MGCRRCGDPGHYDYQCPRELERHHKVVEAEARRQTDEARRQTRLTAAEHALGRSTEQLRDHGSKIFHELRLKFKRLERVPISEPLALYMQLLLLEHEASDLSVDMLPEAERMNWTTFVDRLSVWGEETRVRVGVDIVHRVDHWIDLAREQTEVHQDLSTARERLMTHRRGGLASVVAPASRGETTQQLVAHEAKLQRLEANTPNEPGERIDPIVSRMFATMGSATVVAVIAEETYPTWNSAAELQDGLILTARRILSLDLGGMSGAALACGAGFLVVATASRLMRAAHERREEDQRWWLAQVRLHKQDVDLLRRLDKAMTSAEAFEMANSATLAEYRARAAGFDCVVQLLANGDGEPTSN